jgi:hypothetical protein
MSTAPCTKAATHRQLLAALAGTSTHFNLTVANIGNVALRQLNITLAGVDLVCTGQNMSAVVPHLAVNQHIACGGAFSFDQDALEAGSRNFSPAGSGSNLGGAGAASNVVEVVVAASPQLQVDVDALNCTRPPRMRELPASATAFSCVCYACDAQCFNFSDEEHPLQHDAIYSAQLS